MVTLTGLTRITGAVVKVDGSKIIIEIDTAKTVGNTASGNVAFCSTHGWAEKLQVAGKVINLQLQAYAPGPKLSGAAYVQRAATKLSEADRASLKACL